MANETFKLEGRISPYFNYHLYPPTILLTQFGEVFQLSCECEGENYVFRFREDQKMEALLAMQGVLKKPEVKFDPSSQYLCSSIVHEFS